MVIALLLLPLFMGEATAIEELRRFRGLGFPKDQAFMNWAYAQWVWDTLPTRAAFEAERAKYAAAFDPWFARFKRNPDAAMAEICKLKPDDPIRKGFDLQRAFEEFQYHREGWVRSAEIGAMQTKEKPFKPLITVDRTCSKRIFLYDCGFPDWRTDAERIVDNKLFSKAQADWESKWGKK